MFIDLKRCAREPLHLERHVDLGGRFAGHRDLETLADVDLVLDVAAAGGRKYRAAGRVRCDASAYCARCLEPVPVALERSFQLTYEPAPAGGDGVAPPAEIAYYGDDERLDVARLVEEQVNLTLPMRFLCEDSCRGLCATCGADRNRTPCGHKPEAENRAFAGLAQMLADAHHQDHRDADRESDEPRQ